MEPTDAQSRRIKSLRDTYGKNVVKPHAPDAKTGLLRVELTCAAGIHQWYFNRHGELAGRSLTQRLFDHEQHVPTPHNAIDN